ncbi:TPA: hypothetical protein L3689_001738 [Pseudomonas aeruginosa]|nr:hypothetical protein [Pseudomonas aeruginosa]
MNKANECTCPSGDGSLRWPCPAHPAVEQAVGDERAAFELFVRKHCGMPEHIAVNWDAKFTNDAWEGWQARAALAQPSPAQAEQEEAERPEVVGYLATAEHPKHGQPHKAFNYFKDQHDAQVAHWRERGCTVTEDRLMTVSQHERIVGALRSEIAEWQEAAGRSRSDVVAYIAERAKLLEERDAAQARVAGLEAELETERMRLAACGTAALGYFDGCADAYKSAAMSDVLRLRGDCDAALARVAEFEAQAQHSMPGEFIGRLSEFLAQRGATGKALLRELRTMLAAAPGNSAQHSVPELLEWAVGRWHAEVSLRPLINVHRRALDDTWRQVIRRLGGDTGLLCGPSHDELLAAAPAQGGE